MYDICIQVHKFFKIQYTDKKYRYTVFFSSAANERAEMLKWAYGNEEQWTRWMEENALYTTGEFGEWTLSTVKVNIYEYVTYMCRLQSMLYEYST